MSTSHLHLYFLHQIGVHQCSPPKRRGILTDIPYHEWAASLKGLQSLARLAATTGRYCLHAGGIHYCAFLDIRARQSRSRAFLVSAWPADSQYGLLDELVWTSRCCRAVTPRVQVGAKAHLNPSSLPQSCSLVAVVLHTTLRVSPSRSKDPKQRNPRTLGRQLSTELLKPDKLRHMRISGGRGIGSDAGASWEMAAHTAHGIGAVWLQS